MLHSLELFLINMIPSLVNSCDIFMVTASAVILNTIGLFYHEYHVNYIRKALCCQVACPCPDVDAGLELMTPSRARVHHSAQLVPTIWAPVDTTRKLSNLSPPPPPPPHRRSHNPARNLIWYSVFNQNRSVTLSIPIDTYNCFQTSDAIYCKCNLHS